MNYDFVIPPPVLDELSQEKTDLNIRRHELLNELRAIDERLAANAREQRTLNRT